MMKHVAFFLSIVCLLVFVGCGQGEKVEKATVSEPETATEMVKEGAEKATEMAKEGAEMVKEGAEETAEMAKEGTEMVKEGAEETAEKAKKKMQ